MTSQHARRRWSAFLALAVGVVVSDQLTKQWIDANVTVGAPIPVVGDMVRVVKTYNTGGIFGLFGDSALPLALASLLVIGLILLYQARQGLRSHWLLTVALGLLLGGALGNLIDRLRLGAVIDFVDLGIGELRWYTFNVADAAISTAIVLLVVITLLGDRLPAPALGTS
ncbi:MAG: signal peptidase II [Chloroflexota bacterium]|nr:signal peptidase II [Chloroflexota bacterium]